MAQRTQEFGIRMALGGQARDVLRMVLKQGLKLTVAGFIVGAAGVYGLVTLFVSFFPPNPGQPPPELLTATEVAVTAMAAMILLAGVGLLANYLPARRATQIDPMAAVRYE